MRLHWTGLFGFLFFIGMMAAGYCYNLTFVQFGVLDLGTRLVGMSRAEVARGMALLALATSLTAVVVGLWMQRKGWSRRLQVKLRLAFVVVAALAALTAAAPAVHSRPVFTLWILCASAALGVGVPATFSLATDLVPVRLRGAAGALITAGAYFPAAVLSPHWTVETFRTALLPWMFAGAAILGLLAFLPSALVSRLAQQHLRPEFARGRFVLRVEGARPRFRRRLLGFLVLMFGIYFVDSLGFLRLAETPVFFETAWRSPELGVRLLIGGAHVLAALVAGVLYSALDEKELFLWVFGIFALVHLMYTFSVPSTASGEPPLILPLLYSLVVSLYTVMNFALWADISTPGTISRNSALGVALSGWTATFVSTALALQMRQSGIPLEQHLRIVNALAFLFFLLVTGLIFFQPGKQSRRMESR